jgi:tripartite-type tricarboxylate transporter receptor subunit TctC
MVTGMQHFRRLHLRALVLLCCCMAGTGAAQTPDAARFPARPIRMIVPFPPGGSNDILARFLAQKMSERMGKQTIVDNRAGADGIIGTELAARSPADGHTLLIVSTTYTMNPAIHRLPYDPVKALMPIAQIASGGNVIATHPGFPANTMKDLVALAKGKPGHIRYASSGVGGFNHFGGELFNMLAGVKLAHIPYKGGSPAMLDVMTGQVEVVFSTLIQALPHIRSGKLKPLGVGSARRSPLLPDVPTVSESGVPGYDGSVWWGVLGPAGIPGPIVTRLNTEIGTIVSEPEMAKRLVAEAAEPIVSTPEAFGKLIVNDLAKWSRIAKQAGIRAE